MFIHTCVASSCLFIHVWRPHVYSYVVFVVVAVGAEAEPLSSSSVGSRMLQSMGWSPGSGLGAEGAGIREPVQAYMRPKNRGLGYCKPK